MRRAHSRTDTRPALPGCMGARRRSVEVRRQRALELVAVEPLDLRGEDASGGERRQRAHGEEVDRVGLGAGEWRAAGELAQEQELVDVVDAGWVRVTVLVDERGE